MDLLALALSASILVTVLVLALAFYGSAVVGTQIRGRLEGVLAGSTSVVEGSDVLALRENRTVMGVLRFFLSGAWQERMLEGLQRADSKLQPVDFVAIRFAFAGLGLAVPLILFGGLIGAVAGVAAGALGFQVPQIWMDQRWAARGKKLEEQLPEAITLISNSLKAGFGLLQAFSLAAEQLEHPIATELAQTIHEMNMGSHPDEALMALGQRTQNYDLDLVVTAILVQRSVGGNLSEILDTVAETMRERVRIRGEIKTLTAQQLMTGILLGCLPIGVGILLFVLSPEYITPLFTETMGKVMLGIAVVMEAIGIMVIRRIMDIKV